jgi:CheY-like chemotaxis protein
MRQHRQVSARASPDGYAGPPTILVVEDEPLIRFWMSDELRDAGFPVVEAQDAGEALRVLSSPFPVHLVITDIQMPGELDGAGLVEWLRRERPRIKIIVQAAILPLGKADGLLPKPFLAGEMIRAVRRLLGLDGAQHASAERLYGPHSKR